jgi:hypothetical protein
VKSKTNAPTVKSFNIEAREVVEQLNQDAGYEPVYQDRSAMLQPRKT